MVLLPTCSIFGQFYAAVLLCLLFIGLIMFCFISVQSRVVLCSVVQWSVTPRCGHIM